MSNLIEELEEAKSEYDRKVKRTKMKYKIVYFLEKTLDLKDVKIVTYPSTYSSEVIFESKDCERVELEIIPAISELFGGGWKKEVNESRILYIKEVKLYGIYITIFVKYIISDACEIRKIPTGKTKRVSKYYEIDEPEYEYVVNCG